MDSARRVVPKTPERFKGGSTRVERFAEILRPSDVARHHGDPTFVRVGVLVLVPVDAVEAERQGEGEEAKKRQGMSQSVPPVRQLWFGGHRRRDRFWLRRKWR